MLPAIVGIEFIIDDVIGKAKMSQNKSSGDLRRWRPSWPTAAIHRRPRQYMVIGARASPYIAAQARAAKARS